MSETAAENKGGRPPRKKKSWDDLAAPFKLWGIVVEAEEHGGIPHAQRTFYIKLGDQSLLAYDSPNVRQPRADSELMATFFSVEEFLSREGNFIRRKVYDKFVRHAFWDEEETFDERTKIRTRTGRFIRTCPRRRWADEATIHSAMLDYARGVENAENAA